MKPSPGVFPPGVVLESSTGDGGSHYIRIKGTWDLVNRRDLAQVFVSVPDGVNVVVDVREVTYCDSTILTEFIRLHERLHGAGYRLEVILGTSDMRRLFSLMHLDKILAVRSDSARVYSLANEP
ncbi:MAG: STAS domain-containing protein [Candidatus Eremiobacteraeota bacterium]|nr:STAS domain-containing protein [Candidatus Eremiobacteraeota bacterium]